MMRPDSQSVGMVPTATINLVMKIYRIITLTVLACYPSFTSLAQGFENLDFEWASPISTNLGLSIQTVIPESAFPSWEVKDGLATLDVAFLEGGFAVLISPDVGNVFPAPPLAYGLVAGPLEGSYSLYLQGRHGDWNGMGGGDDLGWIAQTGMVPLGSTTLTFVGWAEGFFASGPHLTVRMAGQSLSLSESLSGQPGISLFSADVGQWAGQVVEMEFVARVPPAGFPVDGVWKGGALIDDIRFIPEPSSATLGVVGLVLVMLTRMGWAGRFGTEPSAAPTGSSAAPVDNSNVTDRPPSVS